MNIVRKNPYLKYVLIFSIFILLLTDVPIITGLVHSNEKKQFTGFYFFVEEYTTYISKMKQGMEGYWKWKNLYTPEKDNATPLLMFYIVSGHLAKFISIPSYLMFQFLRHLFGLWLLIEIYFFMRVFFDERKSFLGVCIYATISGFGFLVLLIYKKYSLPFPVDLNVPEAIGFMTLAGPPHFSFALSMFIRIIRIYFNDRSRAGVKDILEIQFFSMFIALTAPYLLISLSIFLCIKWMFEYKTFYDNKLSRILCLPVAGLAVAFWMYMIIVSDVFLRLWNKQNITKISGLFPLAAGLLPLILSAAGNVFISADKKIRMIMSMAIANILLIYSPVGFSRRFFLGFSVLLTVLAVRGLQGYGERFRIKSTNIRIFALLFLFSAGNIFYVLNGIHHSLETVYPYYINKSSVEAMKLLDEKLQSMNQLNRDNTIIVTEPELLIFVPVYTGRKVYAGFYPETLNFQKRMYEILDFWKNPDFNTKKRIDRTIFTQSYENYIIFGEKKKLLPFIHRYKKLIEKETYIALWIKKD